MKDYLNAISLLPEPFHTALAGVPPQFGALVNEVRLRAGGAVTLHTAGDVRYLSATGEPTLVYNDAVLTCSARDLQNVVFCLARRSLHTYQEMLARGFLPLSGGCKAGVAGCAVLRGGEVYAVTSFQSVNIRVCREYPGCSREVTEAAGTAGSFLIVGPPLSGKTTVLRDLCRRYSGADSLHPLKTAVIDERDEIASRAFGEGRNVGEHTDVLSLYPKAVGMEIALRTLSPDVIVLDEIGAEPEARAMLSAMNSGVRFVATAHGGSVEEVLRRPNIRTLVDAGVFEAAVLLAGRGEPCRVREAVRL